LRTSLKERYRFGNILGRSPLMQGVFELILKAAVTDASVAIYGESGSGKELVAHAIHEHSSRKDGRLVAVNCGAVQESLFEREFFGHRKGAFSSAYADSAGYLDLADKGTLFLDEVSELTVNMQAKLLRAIEAGIPPVGGTETVSTDFRIISASNVPLREKVSSGQMRKDFFYRLQVIQIELPPLRDRKEDIPLLVDHFVQTMSQPRTQPRFRATSWIFSLNTIGRQCSRVTQCSATVSDTWPTRVPLAQSGCRQDLDVGAATQPGPAVQQLESSLVAQALQQAGGNRTRAAALLGISRRALFRKIATSECHNRPYRRNRPHH